MCFHSLPLCALIQHQRARDIKKCQSVRAERRTLHDLLSASQERVKVNQIHLATLTLLLSYYYYVYEVSVIICERNMQNICP